MRVIYSGLAENFLPRFLGGIDCGFHKKIQMFIWEWWIKGSLLTLLLLNVKFKIFCLNNAFFSQWQFLTKVTKTWWMLSKTISPGRMIIDSSLASLQQKSMSSLMSSKSGRWICTCIAYDDELKPVHGFFYQDMKCQMFWFPHQCKHGPLWFGKTS